MAIQPEWGSYGRGTELQQLQVFLNRTRWFFARRTGRRRIGKTARWLAQDLRDLTAAL